MGKINLYNVVKAYLDTLRSYKTGKIMIRDIIIQIIIPAAFSLAFTIFCPLDTETVSGISGNMISGVSIISALLCGVAVMIFQLRLQMASQTDPKPTDREEKLVDETFHDIIWATVAGFASVILMIIASAVNTFEIVQRATCGIAIFFLMNFVLVTCMCIKRLSATYTVVSKAWSKK